jgi:hypothetical protein
MNKVDSVRSVFYNSLLSHDVIDKSTADCCYTSRGHGCGIYSELFFVESKALIQAHSWLCNCISNTAIGKKAAVRNPHRDRAKYIEGTAVIMSMFLWRAVV